MKKKIIICIILSLIISLFLTPTANAQCINSINEVEISNEINRADDTEWYFRMYNGKLQKRLWSKTYEIWLTEWEYV